MIVLYYILSFSLFFQIKNNEKIEKNKFNEINLKLMNLENEKKLIDKNVKKMIDAYIF